MNTTNPNIEIAEAVADYLDVPVTALHFMVTEGYVTVDANNNPTWPWGLRRR